MTEQARKIMSRLEQVDLEHITFDDIRQTLAKLEEKYAGRGALRLMLDVAHYEDDDTVLHLYAERLETDEEVQARVKAREDRLSSEEDRRRAQYLELKKEFGE